MWLRDMEIWKFHTVTHNTHIKNLSDGKPKWQEFQHLAFQRMLGMGLRVRSRGTSMVVLCWWRWGQFDLESAFGSAGAVNGSLRTNLIISRWKLNHEANSYTFEPAYLAPWKVIAEVHRGAMFWNSEMQVARWCSHRFDQVSSIRASALYLPSSAWAISTSPKLAA